MRRDGCGRRVGKRDIPPDKIHRVVPSDVWVVGASDAGDRSHCAYATDAEMGVSD